MNEMTLRWPQVFRRFARDRRGVSAVEFAVLAPVMIGLYLGCVEISDGVSASRKVSLTAATLANLATQVTTISTSDMTNILNASSAIIAPYSASNLKSTLSCLKVDSTGRVTVAWSATLNGTARATGSAITIPSALAVPSSQLLFSEVVYTYTPTVGYTITGSINLSDHMYMTPRITPPTYGTTACS
ncbi:MAG TPA: TadE/TadG family type IV pilus assembly protein [Pseudolabrys sp.]